MEFVMPTIFDQTPHTIYHYLCMIHEESARWFAFDTVRYP